DHNFLPGETVEKQLIILNNSRVTVTCDCAWSLEFRDAARAQRPFPERIGGSKRLTVITGQQERLPIKFEVPDGLDRTSFQIKARAKFDTGETQEDSFAIDVMPKMVAAPSNQEIALFDPLGETRDLISGFGIDCRSVEAGADLSKYDTLIV